MKVRKGGTYVFRPTGWDVVDPKNAAKIEAGSIVRVATPYGCPPPNAMGHAFIEDLSGKFLGLVSTASLYPKGS